MHAHYPTEFRGKVHLYLKIICCVYLYEGYFVLWSCKHLHVIFFCNIDLIPLSVLYPVSVSALLLSLSPFAPSVLILLFLLFNFALLDSRAKMSLLREKTEMFPSNHLSHDWGHLMIKCLLNTRMHTRTGWVKYLRRTNILCSQKQKSKWTGH